MSNIIIATSEIIDNAIISGSSSMGDMTISNLKKRSLKRKWRTTPQGIIEIDLGSSKSINTIALIAHNGSGAVSVKAGDTPDVSDYENADLDLITGDNIGLERNLFLLKLEETYRYWKLEFTNSEDYFEVGRLYVSDAFQPAINAEYGLKSGFIDNTRINRSISGEVSPTPRIPYKHTEFALSFLSRAEANRLNDIDRLRGKSKDVLYVLDPLSDNIQRDNVYGLISELEPLEIPSFNIYQKRYRIEEIPA